MTGPANRHDEHPNARPSWPAEVDAAVGETEIDTTSHNRWSTPTVTVCRFADTGDHSLAPATYEALVRHLGTAGFPVGAVTMAAGEWIVTERPAGHPADRPDLHADPDDLVVAVGEGLRRLHDVPEIVEIPGGWEMVADRCRAAVNDERFNPEQLPAPYGLYSGQQLLDMMIDGRPAIDEPVLCHGRPTLSEFVVDGGTFTGFEDVGQAVLVDRHFDLAIIHQSVHHELGPEAVFRFYEAYGADPDIVRLDHYILVCHLLGLSPS